MLYKVSAENRTFAAAVPYRSVTKNLNIMRSLHILSLILAAVVSIFVAFYLSRHNFKPIGAIVSKLSGYDCLLYTSSRYCVKVAHVFLYRLDICLHCGFICIIRIDAD